MQDSPAYLLSSVVDALKGILAKFSPADQAVVSGLLTSELGAPAVPKKRRLPAPSSTTADPRQETKDKSRTRTKISASEAKEATTPGEVEEECNTPGAKPELPLFT